ncbi:MAG: carboxylesterase/lipase family protein [Spirochaetia bacterium]|jgi:para-nitrobenzyl esterase
MNDVVAQTQWGKVRGEVVGNVLRFRGIPFADRIDGPGRFTPSRPPQPWSGIREAAQWAPPIPQVADAAATADAEYFRFMFGESYPTPASEDGLFLDLWTPSLDRAAKRPVMVWLHGGAFISGAPSRPRDDGASLAAKGDVVYVAPNHRLGALGYLYLDELVNRGASSANVGMLDIVACLEWVAGNIESFGGDPGNVTVFGESGGAFKTATLLAMPKARGLFHRAICQAGVFAEGFLSVLSRQEATELSRKFLGSLGPNAAAETLDCLSVERIISAQNLASSGALSWRPVADGEVLPESPEKAAEHGSTVAIPLLLGTSLHEADVLARYGESFAARTPEELVPALGERAKDLFQKYRAAEGNRKTSEIVNAILSDWFFRIPSIRFAEAYGANGAPVYMYLFTWRNPREPEARATHGSEGPFIFGTLDATAQTRGAPGAEELSRKMQGAWLAFARSGDPNHAGIPRWHEYSPDRRATMVFDETVREVDDPYGQERIAWVDVGKQRA